MLDTPNLHGVADEYHEETYVAAEMRNENLRNKSQNVTAASTCSFPDYCTN
jgi:hypothetical protein